MFSALGFCILVIGAKLWTTVGTEYIRSARLIAIIAVVVNSIVDGILSIFLSSIEPGKSNSEVDNDQSNSHQEEDYVLDDGTNVAAESHVAALLGIVKASSIVVIRCLHI